MATHALSHSDIPLVLSIFVAAESVRGQVGAPSRGTEKKPKSDSWNLCAELPVVYPQLPHLCRAELRICRQELMLQQQENREMKNKNAKLAADAMRQVR